VSESKFVPVAAPIIGVGILYSLMVGYAVQLRRWDFAAGLFCYGIALLGARLARLIARMGIKESGE